MGDLTTNFSKSEFDCRCGCGKNDIQDRFVLVLQDIRDAYGSKMVITSGYRCEEHNKAIGGAPKSAHLEGLAVDIAIDNARDRFRLIHAAINGGIVRIGIAKTFVHLDVSGTKGQGVMWLYA